MIKKTIIATLFFLTSTVATAGLQNPQPVEVDFETDDSGHASGDMVTARFSDNDEEYIGCGIRVMEDGAGGTFEFGFCQAKDASGEQVLCNTDNQALLQYMNNTSDFSYIAFSWNTDRECTMIGFSTQSFYIPELTDSTAP